jgi:HPt (histidine-containing phosphotransfer) domain-containing protein
VALIDQNQLSHLRELAAGDASFLASVIDAFLPQLERIPEELRQAAAQDTPQAVAELAHSLKGSAGNVGAEDVSKLCLEIEQLARGGELDGVGSLIDELAAAARATHRAFEEEKARIG